MKKIKEGLINEDIVRRYRGSNNNGGNNVVDKGKGGGPRSHDYSNVVVEELRDLDANYLHCKYVWRGRMLGVSSQVL